MLICSNCNHQQASGKFCGECGAALQLQLNRDEAVKEVKSPPKSDGRQIQQESNKQDHHQPVHDTRPRYMDNEQNAYERTPPGTVQGPPILETIQKGFGNYWTYYLKMLKNPSSAFQIEGNQFALGFTTIGLYAVLFSLTMYILLNTFTGAFISIPFFSAFISQLIVMAILFLISFGSVFIMIKFARIPDSFKTLITQYGSLLVPFTALNVIAVLSALIGSIQLALISLIISISLAFSYIPVLFVYERVGKTNPNGQRVYLSLATTLLIMFISLLLGRAVLADFVDSLRDTIGFFL